jgi:nucleoside-diphosphate-sugar epimerase
MTSVVITGARGYIGSALTRRLASEGNTLRLVSRSWNAADINADLREDVEYVSADLREQGAWERLLDGSHTIIHLSSHTDLLAAEADPGQDEHLNVDPVRSLVCAAERSGGKPLVVFASAVTIVGLRHANPVNEKTQDKPCSVYDRHKLACETILKDAAQRGVLRACSLRLANVYGFGGDSVNAHRGILNAMMKRACVDKPLTLYGAGAYVRDFIHLDDVVGAFAAAANLQRLCQGEHYVIATGQGHTLVEAFNLIVEEAFRLIGQRAQVRHVPEPPELHPIERRNFVGDSRLFQSVSGWEPKVGLPAGIRDYLVRTGRLPAHSGPT